MKPQFKVSYRGEADYIYNGRSYRVRSFAHNDGHYNGDYFHTGIEPFTGTVSFCHDFHEMPSEEVIAAFSVEHPGIVGARYTENFKTVEYSAPRTIVVKNEKCIEAKFHVDSMRIFASVDSVKVN